MSLAITVASFNLLADRFAVRQSNLKHVPEDELKWTNRRHVLMRQIQRLQADVVCLQEVEISTFTVDFSPLLVKRGDDASTSTEAKDNESGYDVVFQTSPKVEVTRGRKSDSPPSVNAVLFKPSLLELVVHRSQLRSLIVGFRRRDDSVPSTVRSASNSDSSDMSGVSGTPLVSPSTSPIPSTRSSAADTSPVALSDSSSVSPSDSQKLSDSAESIARLSTSPSFKLSAFAAPFVPAARRTVKMAEGKHTSWLWVCNAHLAGSPTACRRRLEQTQLALVTVQEMQKEVGDNVENGAVVVCGDFNVNPSSVVYNYMLSGFCEAGQIERGETGLVMTLNRQDLRHPYSFQSVYKSVTHKEPQFTFNVRGFKTDTMDFIFYHKSKRLKAKSVRDPVSNADGDRDAICHGLPNSTCGSDHLPVCCTFGWDPG